MFTTREALKEDAVLIHTLAEQVFPDTYREILSPEQLDYMMDWMYAPENICKQMDEGHAYLLASKDRQYCGYVSVEQQDKDLFHLQKIYVLPQFQGCKAGRFLFEQAIAYIKKIHPSPCTMELNVNRYNKALHFYERMGMTCARQGDFDIGNGYFMNDYIMSIKI